MSVNSAIPTPNNPIVQSLWITKHWKMEDPNSNTSFANHQHLMDHQTTLPLTNLLPIPVGHEEGGKGPNPRIPTPDKYPFIQDDVLLESDEMADPVIMRKKLDRATILCADVVETGKSSQDENGNPIREIKITYNQPWHGILNGGNRIYSVLAALKEARERAKNGDFSALNNMRRQYMDLVFVTGYTQDQAFQISSALNNTKKIEGWAQLHYQGELDWFVESLNGTANHPRSHLKGEDKYLQSINPNLSKRVAFLAGSTAKVTVEEALQIVRMFNREEFPHEKATPIRVHEAKSQITRLLDSSDNRLGTQLKNLEKVAPYLLMMHDYIRLNAYKWKPGRPVDSFYMDSKTSYQKIVFLDKEAIEACEQERRLLIRSLAHPLCFGLSQYLIQNNDGHWEFLSTIERDANGNQYSNRLDYRSMLSLIDDIGPHYMNLLSDERKKIGGDDTKMNGFLRNDAIWRESYELVKQQIKSHPTWSNVAYLTQAPERYTSKTRKVISHKSAQKTAKVLRADN